MSVRATRSRFFADKALDQASRAAVLQTERSTTPVSKTSDESGTKPGSKTKRATSGDGGSSSAAASGRGKAKRAAPSEGSPTRKRRAPSPTTLPEPDGWRATYDLIEELRTDRTAVVDSMGTEAIAEGAANDDDRAYEALISLMLSSQTKDTVNAATMRKLRAHGCTVERMLATPDETLRELIYGVGFHNNKVKYIKETSAILRDRHGGKVPATMKELLELPGVGPKMSLILLHVAFGRVEGISVDTHVHRICNQLGWAGANGTATPEQTRKAIEAWMPRSVWPDVNILLVGLGQEVQTEKAKLLGKCARCSDPQRAFRLVATLGVDVPKHAKLASIELPGGVFDAPQVD
jgi:endonuclease-3